MYACVHVCMSMCVLCYVHVCMYVLSVYVRILCILSSCMYVCVYVCLLAMSFGHRATCSTIATTVNDRKLHALNIFY